MLVFASELPAFVSASLSFWMQFHEAVVFYLYPQQASWNWQEALRETAGAFIASVRHQVITWFFNIFPCVLEM